jgi:hypothetical protein
LPKVFSSFPLSTLWGERVRGRGYKKKLLAIAINHKSILTLQNGTGKK